MNTIHEEKRHGLTIKIYQDEDAQNPREFFEPIGIMVCFHRRYNLGDKHNMSIEEAQELLKRKDVVSLPLYLYDHGGITMSTGTFVGRAQHAEWDSGQVSFIYLTKETIRKEYGTAGKKNIEKALQCLRGEVTEYDNYLTGNVYGFVIEDETEEEIESCWGFYGDYDGKEYGALHEARSIVDSRTDNGKTNADGQEIMAFAQKEHNKEK